MKHLIAGILCCLLLCGCAAPTPAQETTLPPETAPSGGSTTEPTLHSGEPMVFCSPEVTAPQGLLAFGDGLLLFSGEEATTLTLLTGEDLRPTAALALDFVLSADDPSLVIRVDRLSFYDPSHRQTLVLDEALQTLEKIPAPEGLSGAPVLSRDRKRLYYCTQQALMVWELDTDIRRTVKEMASPAQQVTGLLLGDSVIRCKTDTGDVFLSAENGSLLARENADIQLVSGDDTYTAHFLLGLNPVVVYGSADAAQLLLPESLLGEYLLLGSHPGVIRVLPEADGDVVLEYYDLQTGIRASVLTLTGDFTPTSGAYFRGYLYLLSRDCGTLLRWDPAALSTDDTAVYLAPYATETDPQTDTMARCEAYARQIGQRFGIRVLVGREAASVEPWDYHLVPETQPELLLKELTLLEQRLSRFPEGVISQTAANFSRLTLCLVRSVTGTASGGSVNAATGVQFLDEGEAYVAITVGKYAEHALYHELFHAMETHIWGNSIAFDQWQSLNPSGFDYTYGYAANEKRDAGIYLHPDDRAFVDTYSMSFPKEDRARIFEYAMLDGNSALFRSPSLQAKLQAVCDGLREAYGLKNIQDPLPWEQYLD